MPREEMDFTAILECLRQWRDELEPLLHDPSDAAAHEQAVRLKRQIAAALACLEFCQQHEITVARLREARVLPDTRDWVSEFRIMDDCESGQREDWRDPIVNGVEEIFYAQPGDIVL